jgi:daunorubicin resistance ABC transporter ATP-binding subunit
VEPEEGSDACAAGSGATVQRDTDLVTPRRDASQMSGASRRAGNVNGYRRAEDGTRGGTASGRGPAPSPLSDPQPPMIAPRAAGAETSLEATLIPVHDGVRVSARSPRVPRARSADESAVVVAEGVVKTFGKIVALGGVDLEVTAGSVVALLGRNGAGKSTLVQILSTLLVPDAGRVRIAGIDAVGAARQVRAMIGLAGQSAAVDGTLTGRENLELVGRLYGLRRREARDRAYEVLERLSLTDAGDRLVFTYSGGMRRRLDLGASLVGRPLVLIMDEPTTGLDPGTRVELWRFIDELVREGTTVLLTTQYLEEADRLADRIAVLELGQIIAEGTPSELKSRTGGDVLEVRATHSIDLPRLRALLVGVGSGTSTVDPRWQRITVPTTDPVAALLAAASRIQQSGIAVEDLGLRRPSLDDVFLMLTGEQALAERSAPAGAAFQDLRKRAT